MVLRRLLGTSWGAAALLLTASAQATPRARLVLLQGADGARCVDEPQLRGAVSSRLGYDPFDHAAPTTLVVRVFRASSELFGTVEMVDEAGVARGRRELSTPGDACAEMQRALSLSISLAIDPERGANEPPASAAFEATEDVAPPPAPSPPEKSAGPGAAAPPALSRPSDATVARSAPGWSGTAAITALSMIGFTPSPMFGAGLEAKVHRGGWSAGLGGRWATAPEANVGQGARLRATLGALHVGACYQHRAAELCGMALLGSIRASAVQVDFPRTDGGLVVALGPRFGLVWPMSTRFSLAAHLEGVAVLRPIQPQVDGTAVWSGPHFAVGASLGLRAHFL